MMVSQGALLEVKETLHQYHQDENRVVLRPFSATSAKPTVLTLTKSAKTFLPSSAMSQGVQELTQTLHKLA
jgi:hypothetical protein